MTNCLYCNMGMQHPLESACQFGRCVTHHDACVCREYRRQQEIAALQRTYEQTRERMEALQQRVYALLPVLDAARAVVADPVPYGTELANLRAAVAACEGADNE